MALYEHDIEFGKVKKSQMGRIDSDAFSGKVLGQFMSKQGVTAGQYGQSSKMQQASNSKLGTMTQFMKNDLRMQASTNQFVQRGFKLNKQSLTMLVDFYKLDKKVRMEEREFYLKTKDDRKHQHKKDHVTKIWRRKFLKAAKKAKDNTQTLQTGQYFDYVRMALGGGLDVASGAASAGLGAAGAVGGMFFSSSQLKELRKQSQDKERIERFKKKRLQNMIDHIQDFDKATQRLLRSQRRRMRRDDKRRRKDRILRRQGIGARQTKTDRQRLKNLEQESLKDSKRIGGIFATDEEKAAKKNLQKQAQEYKILRKRGFTEDDINRHALAGTSRSELADSGQHRRRSFSRIKEIPGVNLATKAAGLGAKGLGKGAPGLAVLAGAGLAVHGGRVLSENADQIKEAAMQIPIVAEIKQTFDDVAGLLPKGVKDWFKKTAGGWFEKMWAKVNQPSGGGGPSMMGTLFSAFMNFLDIVGQGVMTVFDVIQNVLMNESVQTTLKSLGSVLVSGGKLLLESATGIINFLTAIFGDEKASFGDAFMKHLYPPIKRFALDFVPKFIGYIIDMAKMLGKAVKNLIIGMVGSKVAGWFGLKSDPSAMTKAATTIQAGQDKLRESNASLARMKGGPETLSLYHTAGMENAMNSIKERERTGDLSHDEAEALRKKLKEISSAEKQVESGKAMRREAKEKAKKESEKKVSAEKAKSTPAPPSSTPTSPPAIDTSSAAAPKGIFKSNSLNKDLADASRIYGIPLNFLQTMARIESRGNPNAVSPTGATGIFQFTRGTGTQYGLVGPGFDNRKNQRANVMAGAKLAQDNASALKRAGLPSTPAYLYLAHQQGVGGAKAITRAAMAGTDVSSSIRRNMDVNGGKGLTPAQFLEKWEKKWASMSGDTSGSSLGSVGSTAVAQGAGSTSGFGTTISSIASNVGQTAMGLAGAFGSAASSVISAGMSALGGAGGLGSQFTEAASGALASAKGAISSGQTPGFKGKADEAMAGAMAGANEAAKGEQARMEKAMQEALASDTGMQQLARTTSASASYTQEMAHKEDKNLLSILDKQTDPFAQAMSGARDHYNSLVRAS